MDPGHYRTVAVGISCMGPLGGNQGYQPYPSGPSQLSTLVPRSLWINGRSNALSLKFK
jgi:hypothetical protein